MRRSLRYALACAALSILIAAPGAPASETVAVLATSVTNSPLSFLDADTGAALRQFNLGLLASEQPLDIDVRPADGKLYLLTVNRTGADTLRLEVVASSGLRTPIGSPAASPVEGAYFNIDFDPLVDELRLVTTGAAPRSFRMSPVTGQILGEDTAPAFVPGDLAPGAPNLYGLAYDQNTPGAPARTAYVFNLETTPAKAFRLMRLGGTGGSPGAGGGALSTAALISPTPGFDNTVPASASLDVSSAGTAFATLEVIQQIYSTWYVAQVDLATGAYRTFPGTAFFAATRIAAMPTTQIAAGPVVAAVEGSPATITLTRSGGLGTTTDVDYSTAEGSATAADFTPGAGTVTFAPGEVTKTIVVPTTQDSADEGRESLSVGLRGRGTPDNGVLVNQPATTVLIEDDDARASALAGAGAGADAVAPKVALTGLPRTIARRRLLGGLKVSLSSSEPAALRIALQATTRSARVSSFELTLASASLKLGSRRRSVTLRPRTRLFGRPRKTVRLRLSVVATDAAGNSSTTLRTFTVTPDRRRVRRA